jgi:hypothetical protein
MESREYTSAGLYGGVHLRTLIIELPYLCGFVNSNERCGLTDSHSHGRGCWFDPSIAHSQNLLLCRSFMRLTTRGPNYH